MAARETALNVLIACRKQHAWVNGALKEYIARDRLDSREAALATRLASGVVQNRLKLDFYLKQLLTGKLRDLHPVIRDVLHLGLYQLYEMDRIPESAAVNESVVLVKKYCPGLRYASGLVNGVLREAQRKKGQLKEPKSWEDRFSHPRKLLEVLEESLGHSVMEPMLKANNAGADTVIQVNTRKTTLAALKERLKGEGVAAADHPWLENCLVLSHLGNLEQLASFREGLYYVQDAAARLSVACAGVGPGDALRVLDCCAAPGGKSFAAAIAMDGRGQIISCDIHEHKISLIRAGAQRLGLENISARVQDAAVFVPEWENAMDLVIADVPCSGYGIIRKKPDIRYKDPASMESLPALQSAILENQARYVKPGGVLLYSTCTLLRRENAQVAEGFLTRHPEFTLESLPLPQPLREDSLGMLTLVPGQWDTDGFFICRMRRKS